MSRAQEVAWSHKLSQADAVEEGIESNGNLEAVEQTTKTATEAWRPADALTAQMARQQLEHAAAPRSGVEQVRQTLFLL